MPLSNNTKSARKVDDAFDHIYTSVTGAKGDHVRTLHDIVMAYVSDELDATCVSFQGGLDLQQQIHILTMLSSEPHI